MESQMGERISDRLCGRILLKQANLDELQREMVSLRGPVLRTFDEVANMLRPLDRPEMLAKVTDSSSSAKAYAVSFEQDPPGQSEPVDEIDDNERQMQKTGVAQMKMKRAIHMSTLKTESTMSLKQLRSWHTMPLTGMFAVSFKRERMNMAMSPEIAPKVLQRALALFARAKERAKERKGKKFSAAQ